MIRMGQGELPSFMRWPYGLSCDGSVGAPHGRSARSTAPSVDRSTPRLAPALQATSSSGLRGGHSARAGATNSSPCRTAALRYPEISPKFGTTNLGTFTLRPANIDAIPSTSLTRTLSTLREKRVVALDEPLSMKRAVKDRRYRIADRALRFWLAFVEPHLGDIDAGRGDIAYTRVVNGYSAWRGRAVEPVVREAVWRLAPTSPWPEAKAVGAWWPRNNNPEIDLFGADDRPAGNIYFVGTIKWRTDKPLTSREAAQLVTDAASVPGAPPAVATVGVCPGGMADGAPLDIVWTADDLLQAWE